MPQEHFAPGHTISNIIRSIISFVNCSMPFGFKHYSESFLHIGNVYNETSFHSVGSIVNVSYRQTSQCMSGDGVVFTISRASLLRLSCNMMLSSTDETHR